MEIAVIVPSRGRPQNAERLIQAMEETVSPGDNVTLVLAQDDDDEKYPILDSGVLPTNITFIHRIDERQGCMGTLNSLAILYASDLYNFDIIGFMGDDHVPRTDAWNNQVAQALFCPGIVYGNDLYQGSKLPTAAFISSSIIRELGHMVPPTLYHLYCDNYWLMLGANAGCLRYLPGMIIEHVHPVAGKTEVDDGYLRVNSPEMINKDALAWKEWKETKLRDEVEKVKAMLYG